jgi:cob(I)alamin adenosyltransferase
LTPPLTAFVRPGCTAASAYAHQARTVCRRAEREVALTYEEPMNPVVVTNLNRLSDWFFALARAKNAVADVQWVPKGDSTFRSSLEAGKRMLPGPPFHGQAG